MSSPSADIENAFINTIITRNANTNPNRVLRNPLEDITNYRTNTPSLTESATIASASSIRSSVARGRDPRNAGRAGQAGQQGGRAVRFTDPVAGSQADMPVRVEEGPVPQADAESTVHSDRAEYAESVESVAPFSERVGMSDYDIFLAAARAHDLSLASHAQPAPAPKRRIEGWIWVCVRRPLAVRLAHPWGRWTIQCMVTVNKADTSLTSRCRAFFLRHAVGRLMARKVEEEVAAGTARGERVKVGGTVLRRCLDLALAELAADERFKRFLPKRVAHWSEATQGRFHGTFTPDLTLHDTLITFGHLDAEYPPFENRQERRERERDEREMEREQREQRELARWVEELLERARARERGEVVAEPERRRPLLAKLLPIRLMRVGIRT
ncbi:hypothetical protein IAT38_007229 [Cryptococcus sp. DSM 104549]